MSQVMPSSYDVRRARPWFVVLLLAIVGLALTSCNSEQETSNLADLNEVRSNVALPELVRSAELDIKAEAQAERMANRGTIFHSKSLQSGVSAGWTAIGENVALAGSVTEAQTALEASPGHYANMTNPVYNHVGIGVVARNGVVYVAQVFVGR